MDLSRFQKVIEVPTFSFSVFCVLFCQLKVTSKIKVCMGKLNHLLYLTSTLSFHYTAGIFIKQFKAECLKNNKQTNIINNNNKKKKQKQKQKTTTVTTKQQQHNGEMIQMAMSNLARWNKFSGAKLWELSWLWWPGQFRLAEILNFASGKLMF